MNGPFDLSGRIAAVTGANTGLGQAIAIALAEAGADIAALGRTRPAETMVRIVALGRKCEYFAVDFGAGAQFEPLVGAVTAKLGPIDILVNNAGTTRRAAALDFEESDWDEVISVNLKSVFFLTQAVARTMTGRGRGKIINIASMLSFQGGIRVASYTASKSALAGLTRLLANEWAGGGINVNAIAPGYISTGHTAVLKADPERNREILVRIPAGRWGDPADLGGAAVFLASSASDYVHGAILPVDGGWLAR